MPEVSRYRVRLDGLGGGAGAGGPNGGSLMDVLDRACPRPYASGATMTRAAMSPASSCGHTVEPLTEEDF
jgi:hypothetical protein